MVEVVFIGTSDAFGAGGRRQSAILLRANDGSVLLDCAPTTAMGFQQLGIDRNEIDARHIPVHDNFHVAAAKGPQE